MLPAELLNEATRCEPTSRRSDGRRLHQRGQERRRYRERLSIDRSLSIEVSVVIFGNVVNPTLKQSDDATRGMRGDIESFRSLPTQDRLLPAPYCRFVALEHPQFNFLSFFEANFFEGFKNPVFKHCVNGFRHIRPRSPSRFFASKCIDPSFTCQIQPSEHA
jgi:hypothetical protein